MRIYFSGIGGVGIGPLAQIAIDANYSVTGSDLTASPVTDMLQAQNVSISIGEQTGDYLRAEHLREPFDFFVYTAALTTDHPELAAAHGLGILCLKRDGLLARIIEEKKLSMVACAGTHGKTTTTGLMVWVMKQLKIPVSYALGTTISYGPSGAFDPASQYFVYECDEYDLNFLHYTPHLSLISSIDYDHPDTYPTLESYQQAFASFIDQSDKTLLWQKDVNTLLIDSGDSDISVFDDTIPLDHLHLPGIHVRQNAFLVERAMMQLFPNTPYHDLIEAINTFPGTHRRMEKLAENLYSDYGHHPQEIAATLQQACEINDQVVLVYQPHQNVRQHLLRSEYRDQFELAKEVYWLPTYLSREDPKLEVLTPSQLFENVSNRQVIHTAEMDNELWRVINERRNNGALVLCMGAGSIDSWLRTNLTTLN